MTKAEMILNRLGYFFDIEEIRINDNNSASMTYHQPNSSKSYWIKITFDALTETATVEAYNFDTHSHFEIRIDDDTDFRMVWKVMNIADFVTQY